MLEEQNMFVKIMPFLFDMILCDPTDIIQNQFHYILTYTILW